MVPVSSAHCVTGRTTSAIAAVSLITMSATTSRSSDSSRSRTWVALGAETTMLLPKTSSARAPSAVPSASRSSYADRPLPGRLSGGDPPHPRDVLAGDGVVDHPVAGELVGLLAVLAAALAVALAGEAAVAGELAARHPQRERHVDPAEHGRGALAVLLGAAGGQHDRPVRVGQQRGQRAQLRGRHARDPLDPLGPPRGRGPSYGVEAGGAGGDVRLVDRAGGVQQVQQPERERQVGARHRLQEQVGPLGGRGEPRVDHDDAGRRARAAGRGAARPAASSRRGWSRPAPARRSARGRRAGTAARGRRRRPGWRPTRPTTCTSGRCSRSGWCRARPGRTSRAGRPSRWSAPRRRRRRPSRRRTPPAARPAATATRSSASSHSAARSSPVARSRTSGVVSRSRWPRSPAAVQPLRHSAPSLTGNSGHGTTSSARPVRSRVMPHCRLQ